MDPFTAVFGLDGATYRILGPLMEDGEVPTIRELAEAGVMGENQTILPMYTTPAWRCYSNGLDPSGVDVYNFMSVNVNGDDFSTRFVESTDFQGSPLWKYLEDEGRRAAILNLHNTAPVDDAASVIVSEHAVADERHAKPASVREILTELDYEEPDLSELEGDEYFETVMEIIHKRFDLAERILEDGRFDHDFLHLSIFYIDSLQHEFWHNEEKIRTAWQEIDSRLGDLVTVIRTQYDDPIISVVSDHGHTELRRTFYLNNWLLDQGYLVQDSGHITERLYQLGLNRDRLEQFLNKTRLLPLARSLVPVEFRRSIPDAEGNSPGSLELVGKVDSEASRAVYPGGDQIYLFEDNETVRREIAGKLAELCDPETGDPLCKEVYTKDELFHDPDSESPDIVLHPTDGYRVSQTIEQSRGFWGTGDAVDWHSVHDRNGIFLMSGGPVGDGTVDVDIYDIMPTLLHLQGCSVPRSLHGEVRTDVLESTDDVGDIDYRDPIHRNARVRDTNIDEEERRERLKDLGYLE